ncbi:MAG TPA: 50S ribosomal protein L29 [Bacillota bacterium]|nr:50S ribosomal protein L29 [Bacillota bacterium]HRS20210.1 50S ribosomal protein L29 [Clostridia bacterium]HRU40483.1 50S ribosomal protein L29 [Candidatus Diapherotrites archaeon]HQE65433.1 50S ribosomal protein L29 [Bacillota bacterium]HQI16557.1 50S ribosomal protein L29 [Bacillota bacterium]
MKANKFRDMSVIELEQKLNELKGELFNLRFQMATGQLENPMRVKDVKKSIARIKTILKENELKSVQAK